MPTLSGYKTYIVSFLMVAYEVCGYLLHGKAPDVETILTASGLATLRAGIAKS